MSVYVQYVFLVIYYRLWHVCPCVCVCFWYWHSSLKFAVCWCNLNADTHTDTLHFLFIPFQALLFSFILPPMQPIFFSLIPSPLCHGVCIDVFYSTKRACSANQSPRYDHRLLKRGFTSISLLYTGVGCEHGGLSNPLGCIPKLYGSIGLSLLKRTACHLLNTKTECKYWRKVHFCRVLNDKTPDIDSNNIFILKIIPSISRCKNSNNNTVILMLECFNLQLLSLVCGLDSVSISLDKSIWQMNKCVMLYRLSYLQSIRTYSIGHL